MPIAESEENSADGKFANRLARAGYSDFYVIGREDARRLLTPKRLKIIEVLREEGAESVRQLSRRLDRDVKQVSDDLNILQSLSVIGFKEEENRKIPELQHDKIFVEPV